MNKKLKYEALENLEWFRYKLNSENYLEHQINKDVDCRIDLIMSDMFNGLGLKEVDPAINENIFNSLSELFFYAYNVGIDQLFLEEHKQLFNPE